ncbi:unnamed protein product, partial [Rotaria sordida]
LIHEFIDRRVREQEQRDQHQQQQQLEQQQQQLEQQQQQLEQQHRQRRQHQTQTVVPVFGCFPATIVMPNGGSFIIINSSIIMPVPIAFLRHSTHH